MLQRKKKDEKKEKVKFTEIKKTKQINSKLFKKCILFTAVQSKLLIQYVKV